MTDSETQAVADRLAIIDLIYRYCRAMDRIDAELGYSIWHEDGLADYGEAIYVGTGRGFIDWVCEQHRQVVSHSHQISNVIVEIKGDHASSEAYVTATLRAKDGEKLKHWVVWGRYLDTWSRRNGRWGIDKRVYLHDFDETHEVSPGHNPVRGRRDRSDMSYKVFGQTG